MNKQRPELSELGIEVIRGTGIQIANLYKKTEADFAAEFPDPKIAELHFFHFQKRRVKTLLKL